VAVAGALTEVTDDAALLSVTVDILFLDPQDKYRAGTITTTMLFFPEWILLDFLGGFRRQRVEAMVMVGNIKSRNPLGILNWKISAENSISSQVHRMNPPLDHPPLSIFSSLPLFLIEFLMATLVILK
jgi:hypothetical protein